VVHFRGIGAQTGIGVVTLLMKAMKAAKKHVPANLPRIVSSKVAPQLASQGV
jgi:hypothetical protein